MKDILKWVTYGSVFAVPFVLLVVSGSMFFPYITGKNFYFRILVEVALGAWLLLALLDQAYRPKVSYILYSIIGLVGVMFVANIFGEYAPKSFWSNYERMEGFVTLVHFLVYFVVLSSVLTTEKLWNWFLNTVLVSGVFMSLYSLGQVAGIYEVSQGGSWRIDGRLGNSSYLGVYMLFQMFIAGWLFLKAKSLTLKYLYSGLIVMFCYLLIHTGTRGTTLGLVLGTLVGFIYLAIMAPKGAAIKKWALGGIVLMVLFIGGFIAVRDTAFVQNNEALKRVAGITWSEGNIRFAVWKTALEGVKERPILGWGQENFNYVFNKYYDPYLFRAETWYDRTHNIFLDWLIAGGFLGLIAYLSVVVSALWYSVFKPLFIRIKTKEIDETVFTVTEQALLLGLFTAYMFHNLVVFDNLASWIFYAVVLALIHVKVSKSWGRLEKISINSNTWTQVLVPSVIVFTIGIVYVVNVPSMLAAKDIINSYRVSAAEQRIELLNQALQRNGFATQEVTEQMSQVGGRLMTASTTSLDEKKKIVSIVEASMNDLIEDKKNDARLYVIFSSFYRASGDLEKALEQLHIAESLSPTKQILLEEQAIIYLIAGQGKEAYELFIRSYELDTDNKTALVRAAISALVDGDANSFSEIINEASLANDPILKSVFVNDLLVLQLLNQLKNYQWLEYITLNRIETTPNDFDLRTNLAAIYYEQGDKENAIRVLEQAKSEVPDFSIKADELIKEIRAN